MTYQILYISHAKQDFEDQDLVALLKKARTTNIAEDVSGFLLYNDQIFIQLLEGEKIAVEKIMCKISGDMRHEGIIFLIRGEAECGRIFPDWSMGFRHMRFVDRMMITGLQESGLTELREMLSIKNHVPAAALLLTIINENAKNFM